MESRLTAADQLIPHEVGLDNALIVNGIVRGSRVEADLSSVRAVDIFHSVSVLEADLLLSEHSLVKVVLNHESITDRHLRGLHGNASLRHLDVSSTAVNGSFLVELSESTPRPSKLETLILHNTHTDDSSLRALVKFPNLKILDLTGTNVTDSGLVHIESLPYLEELKLHNTSVTAAGLKSINQILTLRRLYISIHDAADESIAGLTNLTRLENLTYSGECTDAGLHTLRSYSQLKSFRISGNRHTLQGLRDLKRVSTLESLYFQNTTIGVEYLKVLAEMPALRRLELIDCVGVTDEAMRQIGQLSELKHLCLRNPQITDEGGAHLRDLNNLESLALYIAPVGDRTLHALINMRRLQELRIVGTKVTLSGLRTLFRLPRLRRLEADLLSSATESFRKEYYNRFKDLD